MANNHSFTITISNNITEKEGIKFLVAQNIGFIWVDLATKKQILDLLGLERKYLQSFDLVLIPGLRNTELNSNSIPSSLDQLILVELKTTKKYLPENPKGFFFGATENELNFGKILGDKFKFCFVSLHSESSTYKLLTVNEMEILIRTKRIQYQINM